MEAFFFYFLAIILIVSAILVITRRNPVYSIVYLCVTLIGMAGIFVLLRAHFIAFIQILVYAGAIMVLFLFVVMLLNAGDTKPPFFIKSPTRTLAIFIVVLLLLEIGFIMMEGSTVSGGGKPTFSVTPITFGNIFGVAKVLFNTYMFPFEIASILLLVAMVGAIILSKGLIK